MKPQEDKEFDEGILGAIDAGLESSSAEVVEPVDPPESEEPVIESVDEEEIDHDSPPAPEIDMDTGDDEDKPTDEKEEEVDDLAAGDAKTEGSPDPEKEADPAALNEADKPEPKASDEFGELEADAKPATKERFEKMKGRFDEVSTQLDETTAKFTDVAAKNDAWMGAVKQTKATPDQLGRSFGFLEDINTGTPESLDRAWETVMGEVALLAKVLGKEAPGYDPLDDYPDLKERFNDGDLDRDVALELASGRSRKKFSDGQKLIEEPPAAAAPAPVDENAAYREVGDRLKKTPYYEQNKGQISAIVSQVHASGKDPALFPLMIENAFLQLPKPAPVVPEGKKPVTPNPIRPTIAGQSNDMSKKAGNILEAVDMALARNS